MGRKARRQQIENSGLERLMRNVPAAFDEIRAGLADYLQTHPGEAAGLRSLSSGQAQGPNSPERATSAGGLDSQATLLLLRVLLLLYAGGRGLVETSGLRQVVGGAVQDQRKKRGRAESYRLWAGLEGLLEVLQRRARRDSAGSALSLPGAHLSGAPPHLRVSDTYLRRVLGLLSVDSGSDHGRAESAYAHLHVRGLGDAYELLMVCAAGLSGPGKRRQGGRRSSLRKATGSYYTPESVVRYVVRGALSRAAKGLTSRQILALRVLDPAMGSGHFLLGAADFLAAAYGRARVREGRARDGPRIPSKEFRRYKRKVIGRCLCGVDTDPIAVELARWALWLDAGGGADILRRLEGHLRCGDALSGAPFTGGRISIAIDRWGRASGADSCTDGKPFDWKSEFPKVIGRRGRCGAGFDAVIGNPPYVSFSGRQRPVSAGASLVRTARSGMVKGWPSAHGLFILRAAELVNDRGTISFITPGQMGLLAGYASVRSRLLDVCDLIEVRYWGEDVFKGVTTPALTFIAARREAYRAHKCKLVTTSGTALKFSPEGADPWFTSPYQQVFDRMGAIHGTVETFSDPGVHTGNASAGLLLSEPGARSVPVIEGRQIHPFHCDPPRRWLDLDYRPVRGAYFRISDPRTYRNTDIILRQTASRPVAARHVYGCPFRNSALALKAPAGFSVEYLLGILNSDVAAELYQVFSPECLQESFPQIKVGALRRLPIPDPGLDRNSKAAARIERTVKVLEARARDGHKMDRQMARLNLLVRNLYGL